MAFFFSQKFSNSLLLLLNGTDMENSPSVFSGFVSFLIAKKVINVKKKKRKKENRAK